MFTSTHNSAAISEHFCYWVQVLVTFSVSGWSLVHVVQHLVTYALKQHKWHFKVRDTHYSKTLKSTPMFLHMLVLHQLISHARRQPWQMSSAKRLISFQMLAGSQNIFTVQVWMNEYAQSSSHFQQYRFFSSLSTALSQILHDPCWEEEKKKKMKCCQLSKSGFCFRFVSLFCKSCSQRRIVSKVYSPSKHTLCSPWSINLIKHSASIPS